MTKNAYSTTVPITTSQNDNRRLPSTPMRPKRGYRRAGIALSIAAALLLPAQASAAITIGQLPPGSPTATCSGAADYLEPSVTGGTLYVARQAGTITSWSTLSSTAGATYTLKVFRRTSDPDAFQVMSHSAPHLVTAGLNSVSTNIQVDSGDLIGFHVSGPLNSCTFPIPGDSVLKVGADLGDGGVTQFSAVPDVRLNLAANLIPTNTFTFAGLARDKHRGTATLTIDLPNPGVVGIAGKGLRKSQSKSLAVPGSLPFPIAAKGKLHRQLARKGKVTLQVNATFSPQGGDPSTQSIAVRLKMKRTAALP